LESSSFYSWHTVGFLNVKQYYSTVLYWSYIFYDPILRPANHKRVSDQNIINYQEFILDWRHTLQMSCIDHNAHQSSIVNFLSSILMTTETRSATLQSTYLAGVGFESLNLNLHGHRLARSVAVISSRSRIHSLSQYKPALYNDRIPSQYTKEHLNSLCPMDTVNE